MRLLRHCFHHMCLYVIPKMAALYNLWSAAKATGDHEETTIVADDARAIEHGVLALGHQETKPLQSDAVNVVLRGKDTFLNVPTGYGKSLTYQILPICARFLLAALGKECVGVPSVLVVSPLVALMLDQAQKLQNIDNVLVLVLSRVH